MTGVQSIRTRGHGRALGQYCSLFGVSLFDPSPIYSVLFLQPLSFNPHWCLLHWSSFEGLGRFGLASGRARREKPR